MNLVNDPWIPILRKSGRKNRVAPWQLTEREDPVLILKTGRPDFDGALWQFLIGLLQTSASPKDDKEWETWLEEPPDPKFLKQRLNEKYVDAFDVQGKAGSFMEDSDELKEGSVCSIDQMLIDSPGENTLKKNADHFIKRGRVESLCRPCTVTALFTLQTNAPSGGAGHRTSLRGGGPLTTLVILDEKHSDLPNDLWRNIWMNVLSREAVVLDSNNTKDSPSDIFPWLGLTRTSAKADRTQMTTPSDVHSLQSYWGMPRRIRVDWEHPTSGECDLCGATSKCLMSSYKTKTYGVNYEGPWLHPLTPYWHGDGQEPPFSVKAQPGGLTYRHWANYVSDNEKIRTAKVVKQYMAGPRTVPKTEQFRLYVFGFDMDKAKARCWYETKFPIFSNIDREKESMIGLMVKAAEKCSGSLVKSIKDAWTLSNPKGDLSFLKCEFYEKTEEAFFKAVKGIAEGKEESRIFDVWYKALKKVVIEDMFDPKAAGASFVYSDPKSIAKARKKLCGILEGSVKKMLNVN